MKHILTIAFIFFSLSLFTQNISVSSFERRPSDMDARVNYPEKDQNGDICALLKIETTQTDFVFEGGSLGIIKTEQKVGEYWVYIPWGSKRITIKHPQLGVLRDYTFPESIDKATVYLMKLTTGKVTVIVEEEEIKSQWLIIKSEPEGANVFIDEELVGTTPFQRKYKEGEYSYRLEKSKYYNSAGKLNIEGDRKTIELTLKPKFGSIIVSSQPENGMQIFVDDENTGKTTPATIEEVNSGEHLVKLQSEWYKPEVKEVTVSDGQGTNISFSLQPSYANISILGKPDADILIDGEKQGTGNWNGRLLSGIYTVKIEKDKYNTEEKQLEVIPGQDENLSFELKGKTGSIDIMTTPLDAIVYINDEKQGLSPISIEDILIGKYSLKIEKEGYGSVLKEIVVKEGETLTLEEKLPEGNKQVVINTIPEGVNLSINGLYMGETPYVGVLSYSEHHLTFEHKERITNKKILISNNSNSIWEFDLTKNELIKITSNPEGVELSIDGFNVGLTPFSDSLLFGTHSILLKNGDIEIAEDIVIQEGGQKKWEFDIKKERLVGIKSSPSGLDIYIDDIYKGKTPFNDNLPYGKHDIRIEFGVKVLNEEIVLSKTSLNGWKFNLYDTFIDPRDGQSYSTVKIGNQIWMAENLNYTSDNEFQREIKSQNEWIENKSNDGWCYYNNFSLNKKYGALYQWEAAKNACPGGWHLPSRSEFESLINEFKTLDDLNLDDENEFKNIMTILYAGCRNWTDNGVYEDFYYQDKSAVFWTSSLANKKQPSIFVLYNRHYYDHILRFKPSFKVEGFSVRCIKD